MRTLLGFIGASLLLLAGCQNSQDPTTGTTRVSGQVVESVSRKGVPNATVQVWHESTAGGYGRVGSGYPTDGQGKFAFDFTATDNSGYIVTASAPPGYVTDWVLAPGLTAGRTNENLVIPTLAPAWVKIQLANDSGRKRHHITISGYSGGGEVFYNPRDTSIVRIISAVKTTISWGITDQATGAFSQGYQYVQPNALDTVAVRISF